MNLDTTDQRGAFIRFKENGTSKGWAGCSEGIGTGGDQDDFGIRAVGGFRLRTGTDNRIEIYESGQIALRPITGGFSTHGATTQYPGASVSIQYQDWCWNRNQYSAIWFICRWRIFIK